METNTAQRTIAPEKKFSEMLRRMPAAKKGAPCPVKDILHHLMDKWSLLVMMNLGERGTLRFNELKGIVPGISQKMLTVTLKQLEGYGLVNRVMFPQIPPRVEYSITELGAGFLDHLTVMLEWACTNSRSITRNMKKKD